jgi:hypothetical protein
MELDAETFPEPLIELTTHTPLVKRADTDNNGIDDSDTFNYILLSQRLFNAQNRAR